MEQEKDILQPIPLKDIPKLMNLYKKDLPRALYIYNYLNSAIRWNKEEPDKKYITILAPNGNWEEGTFVGINQFYGYELFMFTLADDCKVLQEVLIKSKEINWNCSMVLYGIYLDHYPMVKNALEKTTFKYLNSDICDLWWMPKEEALKLEYSCPDEVYVAKLNPNHAIIINNNWPYRYPESDNYFSKLIEMNGGYGVFLKSDGSLVSWIVRNLIGFGALQTLEQHRRKNYASLVITAMVKNIAENGTHPVGSVIRKNVVSQALFKKLGFKILESVVFSENQERKR